MPREPQILACSGVIYPPAHKHAELHGAVGVTHLQLVDQPTR